MTPIGRCHRTLLEYGRLYAGQNSRPDVLHFLRHQLASRAGSDYGSDTDAESVREPGAEPSQEPSQEPGAESSQEPGAESSQEPGAEPEVDVELELQPRTEAMSDNMEDQGVAWRI